jgi:peroxiredoxin
VKNPVAVLSQQGGNRFAYVSQEAVVVVDKSGNIVTVWGKDTFDDVVKQVLKDAVK